MIAALISSLVPRIKAQNDHISDGTRYGSLERGGYGVMEGRDGGRDGERQATAWWCDGEAGRKKRLVAMLRFFLVIISKENSHG